MIHINTQKIAVVLWVGLVMFLGAQKASAFAPNETVFEFVAMRKQQDGESDKTFFRRTAMVLRDQTQKDNCETCGVICSNPQGRKSIMIFTGHSQVFCPMIRVCAMTNETAGVETFHSHPHLAVFLFSAIDAQIVHRYPHDFRGTKEGRMIRVNGRNFSKQDYQLGPGYMVFGNEVWHQSGRGTEKKMWVLSDNDDDIGRTEKTGYNKPS